MIIPFAQFGAIHDHATGTVLDATALAAEATARAATLKAQGAGPGAIVAITHGGLVAPPQPASTRRSRSPNAPT
jgi:hypothetical protein